MKWLRENWMLAVLVLAACFFVAAIRTAWGDDDCRGNSCGGDVDIIVDTGASTSFSSLRGSDIQTLSLVAPGLSDVDIAQCLGSTSWSLLVGGKQKLVLNQVCMAEFYLKAGRYDLAAQALCNQKEILAEYATEQECEDAHDFGPMPQPAAAPAEAPKKDDMEDYHAEQQMAYDSLQMQIEELKAKKVVRPIVQKTEFLDAEKRAKLEALRGEK